ncbi:MAG: hypothetical protein U0270_35735 [Labilithrix sp.]
MSGVLDRILAQKRLEIAAMKALPAPPRGPSRGGLVVDRLRRGGGALRLLRRSSEEPERGRARRRSPWASARASTRAAARR